MQSAITRHTLVFINKARWLLSARRFMLCALACLALTACTVGIVRQEALVPATGVSLTPTPEFVSSPMTPEQNPTVTSTPPTAQVTLPTAPPATPDLPPTTPEQNPTATSIPPTTQATLPTAPAPTPDSSTPAIWHTYHNDVYGFTFEYPAIYDEPIYRDSCGINESNDGIRLGHRIEVLFLESNGLSLVDCATNLLQSKGWTLDSLNNVTLNDLRAVTVEYRFGGTNRYGTFTLIEDNARVFSLNFSAGSFCDVPETEISEPAAYARMLETFRLTP